MIVAALLSIKFVIVLYVAIKMEQKNGFPWYLLSTIVVAVLVTAYLYIDFVVYKVKNSVNKDDIFMHVYLFYTDWFRLAQKIRTRG